MEQRQLPVDSREAAKRLGLSPRTLEAWRRRGAGPPYRRFGRAVRYALGDLDAFAQGAAVHHEQGEEDTR